MLGLLKKILILCCFVLGPIWQVFSQDSGSVLNRSSIEINRTILALYKAEEEPAGLRFHSLHRFLELPLNHLGLNVTYWNISEGLPDLTKFPPIRGIISWFYGEEMDQPERYLEWAGKQILDGKKFLIIENLGAYKDLQKKPVPLSKVNQFLSQLNLVDQDKWVSVDPAAKMLFKGAEYDRFEEKFIENPKRVNSFKLIDKNNDSAIYVNSVEGPIPVSVLNQNGGFIFEKYFLDISKSNFLGRWVVDPFKFLKAVFGLGNTPKPDVTTINGRRLYFSHIDGDGWQSLSQIPKYAKAQKTCAELVLETAIRPYPDLPVTVAPIAADLDENWHGNEKACEVARNFFSEPQVQPASHTYSHPLSWTFYDDENAAEKEKNMFGVDGKKKRESKESLYGHELPRAFFEHSFNIANELTGSLKFLEQFTNKRQTVNLIQWSGNCDPFYQALEILDKAGVYNINGGDSRYDKEFPSYSSVCPIGFDVQGLHQIYAVNSNENTYTSGWTMKFAAFKYLKETFRNTESPMRVKGMNLYYHMYSAEKEASLAALLSNLNYIKKQEILPIDTMTYVQIANGFFSTRFVQEQELEWRIIDRGGLNTIRFDQATDLGVDYEKSEGVLGARHYQGSLYVALDPAVIAPLICQKRGDLEYKPAMSNSPYLLQSRWLVSELKKEANGFSFNASGYGKAEMTWVVPKPGTYLVKTTAAGQVTTQEIEASNGRFIKLALNLPAKQDVQFQIQVLH